MTLHPGVEFGANLKSISRGCHLFEVAFVWELTKETIHLPLGSLQGGIARFSPRVQGGGRPNVGEKDVKVCKACCGGLARHHPGAPTIRRCKVCTLIFLYSFLDFGANSSTFRCNFLKLSVQIPQLFRYKFLTAPDVGEVDEEICEADDCADGVQSVPLPEGIERVLS